MRARTRTRRATLYGLAGTAIATFIMSGATPAWAAPSCLSRATAVAPETGWAAPLDRVISIADADLTLRAALDRIAASGRIRLSYSADLLPADRRVCLAFDRVSVGVALSEVLRATMLRPIALDGDNVVLSPSRGPTAGDRVPEMVKSIGVLDRVVVTGTADGAKQRGSPFALDIIDGRVLSRGDTYSLSHAFDGAVPGLWMWTQSPSSMIGRYGSVRGASSFGVTSPKIYIDGIEVANPLVLTQFDPERIDRVEVIRGPQGAALYGADAISGVVNIVSRHDGVGAGESRLQLRTRAGVSSSDYASSGAFVQDHAFSLRAGNGRRSLGLGLNASSVGDFVPGASARRLLADGDFRIVGSNSVITGVARFAANDAGSFSSPLLTGNPGGSGTMTCPPPSSGTGPPSGTLGFANDSQPPSHSGENNRCRALQGYYGTGTGDSSTLQSVRQYTTGTTAMWMPNARWTHTVVAGVDGYRMVGLSSDGIAIPIPLSDSNLSVARSGADRTTLSVRSVAHLGYEDENATTITLAAEHSATREVTNTPVELDIPLSVAARLPGTPSSMWWNSAGLLAQVNNTWRNTLFLSAGGRVERSSGAVASSEVSFLPMLGAAWVQDYNGRTFKLRGSYGKGIRPSNSLSRGATWMNGVSAGTLGRATRTSVMNLEPETQSGIEIGADLLFGSRLGLHVTRFDQRASGLIQAVALPGEVKVTQKKPEDGLTYELQNVGAIDNRGWELQASSAIGRLSLQSSMSFVDSRVARVAYRYTGELRPGDRMLEVPARTFSLTSSYVSNRWATSWTVARAMDWVNYDQLKLAEARVADNADMRDMTGWRLRSYWRNYAGATRGRGNVSYLVRRGLTMVFSGENLLNLQRGEPDNVTIVPGRTLTLGIRTSFY